MKAIALPQGLFTEVDDDVYEWASRLELKVHHGRRGKLYVYFCRRGTWLLHRVILDAKPGQLVDHRNGDGLDNQRANLRLATHSQNAANRPPRGDSGLKGVRWCARRSCWEAYIRVQGQTHRRTGLPTKEAAAAAYNDLATSFHGGFAWLNRPTPPMPSRAASQLRRRPNGVWVVCYTCSTGSFDEMNLRTKDRHEAERRAERFLLVMDQVKSAARTPPPAP